MGPVLARALRFLRPGGSWIWRMRARFGSKIAGKLGRLPPPRGQMMRYLVGKSHAMKRKQTTLPLGPISVPDLSATVTDRVIHCKPFLAVSGHRDGVFPSGGF